MNRIPSLPLLCIASYGSARPLGKRHTSCLPGTSSPSSTHHRPARYPQPDTRHLVAHRDPAQSIDRGRRRADPAAGGPEDQPATSAACSAWFITPASASSRSMALLSHRISLPHRSFGPSARVVLRRQEDRLCPRCRTTASSSGPPTRPPASPTGRRCRSLNDVLGNPINWMSDNRHILAVLVPEGRGPAPAAPRAPAGPNVQESSGRLSQMATFQDMLTNPHDEDLFQHFATSQLARIDTETGQIDAVRSGRSHRAAPTLRPDEKFLLVETIRRPFSYRVPFSYFSARPRSGTRPAGPSSRSPTCRSLTMSRARACPSDLGP